MAQAYTDLSTTSTLDRLYQSNKSIYQLSDGTPVWLEIDGTINSLRLVYSSDRTTTHLISTITWVAGGASNGWTMCVDASDNIYVFGGNTSNNAQAMAQGFTKGAGYTWTAQTAVAVTSITGFAGGNGEPAVTWCNTGGGTSGAGHIASVWMMVSNSNRWWAVFDAGAILAGTTTGLLAASATNPTITGASPTAPTGGAGPIQWSQITNTSFGSTSGWVAVPYGSSTISAGFWTINSSGALTTNTSITTTLATVSFTSSNNERMRLAAQTTTEAVLVYPSSAANGTLTASVLSTSAVTATGAASSITNRNMAQGHGWDLFVDPTTTSGGNFYVVTTAWAAGTQSVYYWSLTATGTTVTWSATQNVADTYATFASQQSIRVVTNPRVGSVDYQLFVQTASGTYALYGDFVPFITVVSGALSMSATAGATIGGANTVIAVTALSATTTLASDGSATARATVAMAGSASETVTGIRTVLGTVTMSSATTQTVAGVRSAVATLTMAITSTLTTAGVPSRAGAFTGAASAGLTVSANVTDVAAVSMAATTTEAISAFLNRFGAVALSATAGQTVVGFASTTASVSMTSVTTLVVAGARTQLGAFTGSGTAGLTVAGLNTVLAAITMAGATGLTTSGSAKQLASVTLVGSTTETISGIANVLAVVAEATTTLLTPTAKITVLGSVSMVDTTGLSVLGKATTFGAVSMSGATTFHMAGAVTYFGVVAMTAHPAMSVAAQTFILAVFHGVATGTITVEAGVILLAGLFKWWDGSGTWKYAQAKGWNGTTWVPAKVRWWNGTQWALVR